MIGCHPLFFKHQIARDLTGQGWSHEVPWLHQDRPHSCYQGICLAKRSEVSPIGKSPRISGPRGQGGEGFPYISLTWGVPKMLVPNNHGFSYWKWSFWGVKWGYHHLRKQPHIGEDSSILRYLKWSWWGKMLPFRVFFKIRKPILGGVYTGWLLVNCCCCILFFCVFFKQFYVIYWYTRLLTPH